MKTQVIKLFGLRTRHTRVRSNEELFDFMKTHQLFNSNMAQYEDPDADYIWCVFYNGELEESVKDIVDYMIENNDERLV